MVNLMTRYMCLVSQTRALGLTSTTVPRTVRRGGGPWGNPRHSLSGSGRQGIVSLDGSHRGRRIGLPVLERELTL